MVLQLKIKILTSIFINTQDSEGGARTQDNKIYSNKAHCQSS